MLAQTTESFCSHIFDVLPYWTSRSHSSKIEKQTKHIQKLARHHINLPFNYIQVVAIKHILSELYCHLRTF